MSATIGTTVRAAAEGDAGDDATTAPGIADERTGQRARSLLGLVLSYVITVLVLVSLNFALPRAMPGDPISAQLSTGSPTYVFDDEARAKLADYYDLDRPVGDQFVRYMTGLAKGDLGVSVSTRVPVAKLIKARLPWTLLLVFTGVVLATAVGFLAGVHAGWRRERRSDRFLVTALIGLQNVPSFVLASMTLLVFAVQLAWFPLGGGRTPFSSFGPLDTVVDVARHLALPAFVLATEVAALQFLLARGSVVTELGADYLVLGRVKGLPDRHLKYRYAARNALIPVVSNTAVQLGAAITGAVFVERVFAYPGIGGLIFGAIANRDYTVIQGCFLVVTILVLTLNFLSDIAYRRLDPRTA